MDERQADPKKPLKNEREGSMESLVAPVALSHPLPLTHRLAQFVSISPEESAILADLQSNTRTVNRHRDIVTEGRSYGNLFVVIEGIAIRYRILHDGRRQIVNLVLPGDIVGIFGAFFENTLYSTKTLTEMVIATIPFSRVSGLFASHPRLITKLFWSFSCESAIYAEHIVDIGRRSALERIAHFFMELLVRLQTVGLADERSYRIPLTQELIGDALGLSVPHVNRVLRRLREEQFVVVEDQRVTIKDIEALSELADFEPSYLSRFSVRELLDD
jgi:CRP-like cAMP-binding protein